MRHVAKWLDSLHRGSEDAPEKWLRKSIQMLQDVDGESKPLCAAHFTWAEHLHGRLTEVEAQLASAGFRQRKAYMKLKEDELKDLINQKDTRNWTNEETKKKILYRLARTRRVVNDLKDSVKSTTKASAKLITKAIDCYSNCLSLGGNEYRMWQSAFGLTAIWLRYSTDASEFSNVVDTAMNTAHSRIPAKHLRPVLKQLVARLEAGASDFLTVLRELLTKLVISSPQETLVELLPILSTKKDAVTALLIRAIRESPSIEGIIEANRLCFDAYCELAPFGTETKEMKNKVRGQNIRWKKLRTFTKMMERVKDGECEIPLLTADIIDGVPLTITDFHDHFTVMGSGISLPKLVKVLGSDGRWHKQICKKDSDVRQDAVAEQLFANINGMLNRDDLCKEKQMRLRTYNVICLSSVAAVLEFVDGSVTLLEYLVCKKNNKQGAHYRFRPNEPQDSDCRRKLMNLSKEPQKLLKEYNNVCKKVHPVMHHFFEEHFPSPCEWFHRRQTYTASMATASMAGFVMGIGDRHCDNIMLDSTSGEVVHIDFGYTFDMSQYLQIPERVPFRLTRDLVDGMGVCGTEGTFRRLCEETMRVLRANPAVLLTIIEVFVHDPMFQWSAKSKKKKRKNDSGEENIAEVAVADAKQAVRGVRRKLEGREIEGGVMLDVPVQVERLINTATDPYNLCRMFVGWSPWL
eukprot:TRINITY_DN4165_c0_g2_i2.p1 TRINITY_DN4165_c0_g2~~TRINITY_DN4165_c0_g2_i2.p1  ORF type:complete len:690 (-),score=186.07 TRINITY_DN4165_c0_g2_i2:220-2289(-)